MLRIALIHSLVTLRRILVEPSTVESIHSEKIKAVKCDRVTFFKSKHIVDGWIGVAENPSGKKTDWAQWRHHSRSKGPYGLLKLPKIYVETVPLIASPRLFQSILFPFILSDVSLNVSKNYRAVEPILLLLQWRIFTEKQVSYFRAEVICPNRSVKPGKFFQAWWF